MWPLILGFFPITEVLKEGLALCVVGASVREICSKCDLRVEEETAKVQSEVEGLILARSVIHFKSSVFAGVQEGQEGAEGHRVPLLRLGQQLHLPFLANEQWPGHHAQGMVWWLFNNLTIYSILGYIILVRDSMFWGRMECSAWGRPIDFTMRGSWAEFSDSLLRDLGWVDFDVSCFTICQVLHGLMGIWRKRLGKIMEHL